MTDLLSDLSHPIEKPFLSKIIEVEKFKKGRANIVIAPCHSGKTTAIGEIISAYATRPEKVLCLIDTTAGKEALVTREHATAYRRKWLKEIRGDWWGSLMDGDGFRVMTYHQFGWEYVNQVNFLQGIELIICDEMHNLIKYKGIENSRKKTNASTSENSTPCHIALDVLTAAARDDCAPMIVVMTATVNAVSVEFNRRNVPCSYFDYTGKAHCDLTRHRHFYAHFEDVISQLPSNTRAIIYVAQISKMLEYAALANNGERKICCLWGLNSSYHKMNDDQLKVRRTILDMERIPPDIDLLFINAAYETSINIVNEDFNTMIIHNGSPDIQTQVRGRIRHDIEDLYLYDTDYLHISHYFPSAYFSRPLFREDIAAIVEIMNLRNKDNRQLKWSSIYKLLEADGMNINKQKINGRHCWTVHPNPTNAISGEVA